MFLLISVYDREITTEKFETLPEAQSAMRMEMLARCNGMFAENIFERDKYEDYNFGFNTTSGYVNDAVNHEDCDWLIVSL